MPDRDVLNVAGLPAGQPLGSLGLREHVEGLSLQIDRAKLAMMELEAFLKEHESDTSSAALNGVVVRTDAVLAPWEEFIDNPKGRRASIQTVCVFEAMNRRNLGRAQQARAAEEAAREARAKAFAAREAAEAKEKDFLRQGYNEQQARELAGVR